jgi:hypothetical protein
MRRSARLPERQKCESKIAQFETYRKQKARTARLPKIAKPVKTGDTE